MFRIENAVGRNNGKKACKRRLSMLTNSMASLNNSISNMSDLCTKSNDYLEEHSTLKKETGMDAIDGNIDVKRTCAAASHFLTPQLQFRTPIVSKTVNKLFTSKQASESNFNPNQGAPNQLVICNSFVYATCRDALNEDLNSKSFSIYRKINSFFDN